MKGLNLTLLVWIVRETQVLRICEELHFSVFKKVHVELQILSLHAIVCFQKHFLSTDTELLIYNYKLLITISSVQSYLYTTQTEVP